MKTQSTGSWQKKHNQAPDAKAEIRRRVTDRLGGVSECSVLETHSGPGTMRRLVYGGARDWLGIDSDVASPDAIHADNVLVLRAIDLGRFNLFDVDAFGMPWHQLWLVGQRRSVRRGERIGLAMTSGTSGHIMARSPDLKFAGWSTQMLSAMGIDNIDVKHKFYTGRRFANQTAQLFVRSWFPSCMIDYWVSSDVGDTVWYFGCVLKGVGHAA